MTGPIRMLLRFAPQFIVHRVRLDGVGSVLGILSVRRCGAVVIGAGQRLAREAVLLPTVTRAWPPRGRYTMPGACPRRPRIAATWEIINGGPHLTRLLCRLVHLTRLSCRRASRACLLDPCSTTPPRLAIAQSYCLFVLGLMVLAPLDPTQIGGTSLYGVLTCLNISS